MALRELDINDLPKYSRWPARILGADVFHPKKKTPEEIDREYNQDKWGKLLKQLEDSPQNASVEKADAFFAVAGEIPINIGAQLYLTTAIEARALFIEEVRRRLLQFLPAPALVELGAGYGSVLLRLAKYSEFTRMKIVGAEYTENGISSMAAIAAAEGMDMTVGPCDFGGSQLTTVELPENALIYTCMAAPYLPILPQYFIDNLILAKPSIVVHFEPCIDHFDDSMVGLLRSRYIEINDYNRNLMSLLYSAARDKKIDILHEEPCFFGENPLLPCSYIAWKPRIIT